MCPLSQPITEPGPCNQNELHPICGHVALPLQQSCFIHSAFLSVFGWLTPSERAGGWRDWWNGSGKKQGETKRQHIYMCVHVCELIFNSSDSVCVSGNVGQRGIRLFSCDGPPASGYLNKDHTKNTKWWLTTGKYRKKTKQNKKIYLQSQLLLLVVKEGWTYQLKLILCLCNFFFVFFISLAILVIDAGRFHLCCHMELNVKQWCKHLINCDRQIRNRHKINAFFSYKYTSGYSKY